MAFIDELQSEVTDILAEPWSIRDGTIVPETDDVALAGGAVRFEATMLYADLVDSTSLAIYDRRLAARVFKSFLSCCSRVIRERGGYVRSFDGDRVMAVFLGGTKNSSAARAALNINHCFLNIIKPKLLAKYEVLRNGSYTLGHCVGVDTSEVLAVRAGIRNNNDLTWVGSAPNIAAKLSTIRNEPYNSWITGAVYDRLSEDVRKSSEGHQMWEKRIEVSSIPGGIGYRSSWSWKP